MEAVDEQTKVARRRRRGCSLAYSPAPWTLPRGSEAADVNALLEAHGISKTFGDVKVLQEVDVLIQPGEVAALVGHNGSGKSTLIKILAGFHSPDAPTLGRVDGDPFKLGNYESAHAAGLRFVHQDLGLADSLDAVDNLAMVADYPRRRGIRTIAWRHARRRATRILSSLGYDIPVNTPVGKLSQVERTGIAIARGLQDWPGAAKVIVLDEPTATMPAAEAARLFDVVHRLREQGLGVLYVTHHLDEVIQMADSVTVLRDGRQIVTRPVAGLSHAEIVELMLGRQLAAAAEESQHVVAASAQAVLKVEHLSTGVLRDISLTVQRGETVGVAGITGSGHHELLEAIAGAVQRKGSVEVAGTAVPPNRPHRAVRAGLAFVPDDRQRNSIVPGFDLQANMTASGVREFVRRGLLSMRAEQSEAMHWIDQLDVRPADPQAQITALSGGNQQKAVVGRWLRRSPKVMVLIEPTQGVDVGARASIYAALKRALEAGGVLLSSSDADELAALCDRVLILRRGRLIGELSRSDVSAEVIESMVLGAGTAVL
jgi:ribose transport system ATP-binding protein